MFDGTVDVSDLGGDAGGEQLERGDALVFIGEEGATVLGKKPVNEL